MKDGRKIALKTLFLIKLRKILREIIYEAYTEKYVKLTNKIIQEKKTHRAQNDDQIKAQMKIEIINLRKKQKQLKDIYYKSIQACGTCNTLEGDRIYYKGLDKWFCPKCFERNIKHWSWEPKYPLSKDQVIVFLTELEKVAGACQTNLDLSREILKSMGINKSDQKIFLDTLYHYGGHCDCEIMLNTYPNIMVDFDLKTE